MSPHHRTDTNLSTATPFVLEKNDLLEMLRFRGRLMGNGAVYAFIFLFLEAAHTALASVLGIGPQPLDHPGIVVAVRQVVVQS
jgi:hypothetical protein